MSSKGEDSISNETDEHGMEEEILDQSKHASSPPPFPTRVGSKKAFELQDDTDNSNEISYDVDHSSPKSSVGRQSLPVLSTVLQEESKTNSDTEFDLPEPTADRNTQLSQTNGILKKKPIHTPSTILLPENSNGPKILIAPASPLVQTGPLHLKPESSTVVVNEKLATLLWNGGHIWKIPFNGRGSPEHRVVAIKRATFPSTYARRVQLITKDGKPVPSEMGTFICHPPTLLWYNSDGKTESLNNARELVLYEGTRLTEGHNTSAFWKLSSRNKPIPKPELCFSVVTSTRSLDMAAESIEEADDWKLALKLLLETLTINPAIELTNKVAIWGQPQIAAAAVPPPPPPLLPSRSDSQLPLPPNTRGVRANTPPLPPPLTMEIPSPNRSSAVNRSKASNMNANNTDMLPPNPPSPDRTGITAEATKARKDMLKKKMFSAAHANDIQGLKETLLAGVPVNLMEPTTADTPLMIACRNGNAAMVKLCLQYGAKNDPHPDYGLTALHVAVESGHVASALALLNAAAQTQADLIVTNLTDAHGQTVLHFAALKNSPSMLEMLLRHGSDPNKCDDVGLSPVHIAAGVGYESCLAMLLDHDGDASIDAQDREGNTPLHHASCNGHIACVKLLLESAADVAIKNKAGHTAYQLANNKGHQQIALLLLDYLQQGSWTNSNNLSKSKTSGQSPIKADPPKPAKLLREHSANSIEDSEDSSYSIDIQTPQKSRTTRSQSLDMNHSSSHNSTAGFTPILKRKQSDELLPRPHTASPSQPTAISSRSSSGNNLAGMTSSSKLVTGANNNNNSGLTAGKSAVMVQRNPLIMSARETKPVSPLSASGAYAPLSARESGSQRLFDGMEVISPTRSKKPDPDISPMIYASNPIPNANPTSRAEVYARRNGQGGGGNGATGGFAEPLSDFDIYLMKGFEAGNSPYDMPTTGNKIQTRSQLEKERLIDYDDAVSTDYGTPEYYANKTFIDQDNSYDTFERNIDNPGDSETGVIHAYQDNTGLPDKLPYDSLQGENQLYSADPTADQQAIEQSQYDHSGSYETFEYEGEYWDIYMTEDGYYYYLNSVSYHSQWYDPREYGYLDENYNVDGTDEADNIVDNAEYAAAPDAVSEPVEEELSAFKSPPRLGKGKSPTGSPDKKFRHSPARVPVVLRRTHPGSSSSDSEEDEQDIIAHAKIRTANSGSATRRQSARSGESSNLLKQETAVMLDEHLAGGLDATEEDDVVKAINADWDADNSEDHAHVGSDWDKDSVGGRTPKGIPFKFNSSPAVRTPISTKAATGGTSNNNTPNITTNAAALSINPDAFTTPVSALAGSPDVSSPSRGILRPPPIVTGKSPIVNSMPQTTSAASSELAIVTDASRSNADVVTSDSEVTLQKFVKMKNIGIPTESIVNQMKIEGVDGHLIERLVQTKGTTPRRVPAKKEKLSPTPKKSHSPTPQSGVKASSTGSVSVSGSNAQPPVSIVELKEANTNIQSNADAKTKISRKTSWEKRVWDKDGAVLASSRTASASTMSVMSTESLDGVGLMSISDDDNEADVFIDDKDEFQKLFGSKSSSLEASHGIASKIPAVGKMQQPSKQPVLLERKRAENIIIGMVPFKTIGPPRIVFKAICSLNNLSGSLRADNLEGLITMMPTSAELQNIEIMRKSTHPAEEFLCLSAEFCPQLPRRLKCFIMCETFQVNCSTVIAQCLKLTHVCRQILESEKLAKFLQNMAKVDAMLKQSQRDKHSDAEGFSLRSLLKIISVKGADKKTSVLDYVVKNMRDKGEEKIKEVTDDLQVVESSFEMSGLSIEQSANDLLLQVGNLKSELRDAEAMNTQSRTLDASQMIGSVSSQIAECNEQFCVSARQQLSLIEPYVTKVSTNLEEMKTSAVDLSHYFGHGDGIEDTDTTEIITALKKLRQAIVTSRYIITGEQRTTSGKVPPPPTIFPPTSK